MSRPFALRVLVAAAILGAAIGAIVGALSPTSYRASVTMLVAHGGGLPRSSQEALQGARTVSALAVTESVSSRVASSLHLDDAAVRRSLSARPRGSSGLVVVTATASSPERAVRVAQQAGLVISELVLTRVGSSGLRAAIWDPARPTGVEAPSAPLDALWGALAAAALAALAVAALRWRPLRRETGTVPAFEQEIASETGTVPASEPELPPVTGTVPGFAPEPAEPPAPLEPEPGRYSLPALERLIAAAPLEPARRDELDAYLAALRGREDASGLLPESLAPVVGEVFGDLL